MARWPLGGLVVMALGACGEPTPEVKIDPIAAAAQALDAGAPKKALAALASGKAAAGQAPAATGDAAQAQAAKRIALQAQALIALDEWGEVESLLKTLTGDERQVVECIFGAVRRDVRGERLCRTVPTPAIPAQADAVKRALARVVEGEHRLEEAELTLRELVKARPTIANRRELVDFFERQGFVKQAVDALEEWLASAPGDKSIEAKLVGTLERKVRGDLLDKRADEAIAAARRILALAPTRAEIRYFLADALALKGDTAAAEAEKKAAQAAGAVPPKAVDTFPGLDAPAGGMQGPAKPHAHGPGDGHDHGHDH